MADEVTPRTCTTLDHVWKIGLWTDRVEPGQRCYCGARKWGVEHKPRAKRGAQNIDNSLNEKT